MNKRALLTLLLFGSVCMAIGRGNVVSRPVNSYALADSRLVNRIMRDIKRVYGEDLANPKYDVMDAARLDDPGYSRADEVRAPADIINDLNDTGFNERTCPDNADHCFTYCVDKTDSRTNRKSSWILMISKIGPYVVLFRDLGPNRSVYVPNNPVQQFPLEKPMVNILKRGNYILMDSPTLSIRVGNLELDNTRRGSVRVYHALFRDIPGLPRVRG
jgi:hypothetical protein